MSNYEQAIAAIETLSAPLEILEQEIDQIKQAIQLSGEVGRKLEKDHPESYPIRMLAERDMNDWLNQKIAERDAYVLEIQNAAGRVFSGLS